MKKRGFALLLALLLLPCMALGEPLLDMKASAPENVHFTIGGTDFTAPVILPEGDTLPTLLCRLYIYQEGYYGHWALVDKETKDDMLYGDINKYGRVTLAPGELPPENDLTIEEAVAFAQSWFRENAIDNIDFRLDAAVAQSGLCQIHGENVKIASGISVRTMLGDITKPIKGLEKGLWEYRLAQYFYGAKLFFTEYWRSLTPVDEQGKVYDLNHPQYNHCLMLDAENYNFVLSALLEDEKLVEDTQLLPIALIAEKLNALIDAGDLKSVYRLQLGYMYLLVRDDYAAAFDYANMHYVLFPCWEVVGYVRNVFNSKKFDSLETPDEQTALFNNFGFFARAEMDDYRLLIDARTGEVMTSDMLYLLPEEVYAQ